MAANELDLRDVELGPAVSIRFASTTLPVMRMDGSNTSVFNRVDDRKRALMLVIRSAGSDGDLSTANTAEFELNALRARDQRPVLREFVIVVGEWMGGYLVRPTKPGTVLALLFGVAFLVHLAIGWSRLKPGESRLWMASSSVTSAWDTLNPRSWPPRPEAPGDLVGWTASALATGLLTALVLSLANSVPVTGTKCERLPRLTSRCRASVRRRST
jgi:hypothetical protein